MQAEKFDQWALVELMGRQRIAGRVTERVVAGVGFLDVNVPETSHNGAFTRLIHPNSLYAINPVDEKTARTYAEQLQVQPIEQWDIHKFLQKADERKLALSARKEDQEDEDDDRDY